MPATDKQLGGRGNVWGTIKEATELDNLGRLAGLGMTRWAKMTYDFTVDGGAIGTLTPANSPLIPVGAIVFGGILDVTTILASGGGATVGLGFGSGAQVASLLAPAAFGGAPWSTTGLKALIPVFTAASSVKVAADTRLTLTIAAGTLTGGKFDVNICYFQGNL
jgi:hypothetical protein